MISEAAAGRLAAAVFLGLAMTEFCDCDCVKGSPDGLCPECRKAIPKLPAPYYRTEPDGTKRLVDPQRDGIGRQYRAGDSARYV